MTSSPNRGCNYDLLVPPVSVRRTEVGTQDRNCSQTKPRTDEEFPTPTIKAHPLLRKARCSDFKHCSLCLIWIPWFSCCDEEVPVLLQTKKNSGLSRAARPCGATEAVPWSPAVTAAAAAVGSGCDPGRRVRYWVGGGVGGGALLSVLGNQPSFTSP